MKIHVILTGGTIGSRINDDGYIANNEASTFRIIDMYQKKYDCDCSFTASEPYNILSENLAAKYVIALYHEILSVANSHPDGIIVTHGTDSLQYCSTLISYMCGHLNIPIVFVSSAYVLDDPRANGLINFDAAINFIKTKPDGGVYVSYKNENDIPYIHIPTRLHAPQPFTADISSIKNNWYACYQGKDIITNCKFMHTNDNISSFGELLPEATLTLTHRSNVIRITPPYAGIRYPELTEKTKAVLLETYHSGTLRANTSLKEFTNKASEMNIPVYLTGLSDKATDYKTVSIYDKLGIIPLKDSSSVSQFCKLWIALSNNVNLNEIMHKSVAYDKVL